MNRLQTLPPIQSSQEGISVTREEDEGYEDEDVSPESNNSFVSWVQSKSLLAHSFVLRLPLNVA